MNQNIQPKKIVIFPGIAAILAFLCFVYGAYRGFMDLLYDPLARVVEYVGAVRLEDKVLGVVLILGLAAIYAFRTRRPEP